MNIFGQINEKALMKLCDKKFKSGLQGEGANYAEKSWGAEYWLVNSEKYCSKILKVDVDKAGSIHTHKLKTETFVTLIGQAKVEIWESHAKEPHCVLKGDCFTVTIRPGQYHRLSNIGDETVYVLEVSTEHFEEDSYRIQPGVYDNEE